MQSVRVLQAMAGAAHGGAELFFERLTLALHRAGSEQRVLIRRNPQRAATLQAGGIAAVELPFGGLFDFTTKRRFAAEITRFAPQVVLSWMNRATRFTPPKTTGKGFVHVARLGGYYDLKYYQACDHLVCNTQDLVEYVIREGWPSGRAHYLPNFAEEVSAPPVSRVSLNTPETAPVLFALGRLHGNKGFDTLLRAFAQVPGAYLWIAGEGPERVALEALAQELGVADRLRLLGWRNDAPALHAAADLFVCPSRHEPLGNVVIEAWAQGSPVVAAASQGPCELITPGVTGLLTPVDDVAAMAHTLNAALADRATLAAMAEAGRAAYQAQFTEAAVVARYQDFFRRLAAPAV